MCKRIFKEKKWIVLCLILCLCWISKLSAYAMDIEESLDFSEIEKMMEDLLPNHEDLTFSELVDQLVSGDGSGVFKKSMDILGDALFSELKTSRLLLVQVIGIVVISAVFTNFSMAFSKTFIAETGFYLSCMLLFTLLLTSFMSAVTIAREIMEQMTAFVSVLLPVFCLAIMLTGNIQTGIGYQQAMLAVIAGVEWVLSKYVFMLVEFYVLISMVNQLSKEDILSKSAELIKSVVQWSTKTGFACVIGINFIQGLILPAFDSIKNGWTVRLTSVIPGVGDAMESVVKTMGGAAVLIKNGVGVAGLIVLILLFLIPAVKLVVLVVFYMAAQAVVQPVADKRMLSCLHYVSEGVLLLLKIEGTVCILFFVSLAVMAAVSGNVFGG